MDRDELRRLLDAECVKPNAYRLDGLPGDDILTLDATTVFYSERGRRGSQWHFATESQACEFLAAQLLGEPHNRLELVAMGDVGDDLLALWLAERRLSPADITPADYKIDIIAMTATAKAVRLFIHRRYLRDHHLLAASGKGGVLPVG